MAILSHQWGHTQEVGRTKTDPLSLSVCHWAVALCWASSPQVAQPSLWMMDVGYRVEAGYESLRDCVSLSPENPPFPQLDPGCRITVDF